MLSGRLIKIIIFCLILILTGLIFLQSNYNSSSSVNLSFREKIKQNIEAHIKTYNSSKSEDNANLFTVAKKKNKVTDEVKVSSPKIIQIADYQFDSVAQAEDFYFNTITKDTIKCPVIQRLGRSEDGGWDLCLSEKLIPKKENCIVYSFGVNYIWEFDDELSTKYGCTVRTFDPSMTNEPNEFQRPSKVWFYKIGLGKEDVIWSNGWKIKKLLSLLKKFNDQGKVIDVLKIDIEFSEWDSFESMLVDGLLTNVKQLLFETHTQEVLGQKTSIESYSRFLKIWNGLYKIGFRQWKHHWNHFGNFQSETGAQRTCCYEHYMININFL